MDTGYYDYYKIMKTVVDIGWDGLVHLDHAVADGRRSVHLSGLCRGLHARDAEPRQELTERAADVSRNRLVVGDNTEREHE